LEKRYTGKFITFEGPEGSGKSTHSKLLCAFLRQKGFKVLHTREPGGTLIGEKIRHILLDNANKKMSDTCELLLYMAARAQIVEEKILPALKQGKVVLCDRFLDASLAYQGYGAGLDLKLIEHLGKVTTAALKVNLTILLDIESRKGLKRSSRGDRLEMKAIAFHKRVRKGYLKLAGKYPRRIKLISAIKSIDETQEKIRKIVLDVL
jgi:dTMP kinase